MKLDLDIQRVINIIVKTKKQHIIFRRVINGRMEQ